jgi:hypothetical protein
MADSACRECGGELIGPVVVESVAGGTGGELQLKVAPTSGVIRMTTRSQVTAMLCTNCGAVKLYADPAEITEHWRQGER